MIEVELRSFITPDQFDYLLTYFLERGRLSDHTRQVTYYLNHDVDTRIQISTNSGKVWQKLGKMHDPARVEYEVVMAKADAQLMLVIFRNLGFDFKVAWYRERRTFVVDGVTIALDDTIGYGKIVELEILCEESQVESNRIELMNKMHALGLEPTDKGVFDGLFDEYLRTWRTKTADLDSSWVNSLTL